MRRRLLELDFRFDSLVMEEAAQVTEVETLVPMLSQRADATGRNNLKRVVLIGDHHQLPPVIQCTPLRQFAGMDQSLFARLIRLGVPHVLLDVQGRCRPELASLFNWRYTSGLRNLPILQHQSAFCAANPGFAHCYQVVDVPLFQGLGESTPSAHFYQNLGEAEYVVGVYMYMRLLGYPSDRISILTTYNGQKALLEDVLRRRCSNAIFGMPGALSTVDQYQGRQNDFVLLSLVRTESVGHLRDVRRLVVALSRSRLGTYVFCKLSLFANCFELGPAFKHLLTKPSTLELVVGETWPGGARRIESSIPEAMLHRVTDASAMGNLVYEMVGRAT
jgi:intron-binding protein aquarius